METLRTDGRACDMLRPIILERAVNRYAEGSALIRWGNTHVLCTASVDDKVPPFLRGSGNGWITAEYAMLPRSTQSRMQREISRGKRDARGSEIQRLIGRSLRAAVDMTRLGERTITIDCDVLQADGGTRCASITGAYVALVDAVNFMLEKGMIEENPIKEAVCAISVGMTDAGPVLDLDYEEDSTSETDMNVVMTSSGRFIELQGTAEGSPFSHEDLTAMLALAKKGCEEILAAQKAALAA